MPEPFALKPPNPLTADRNGSAAYTDVLVVGFGTTDLTARSGMPNHAPQLVDVKNLSSSDETLTYTTITGVTKTITIMGGEPYPINVSVVSVNASSGDNLELHCHWWPALGHEINS